MYFIFNISRYSYVGRLTAFIFKHYMVLYHLQYLGQGSLSRRAVSWELMRLFFSLIHKLSILENPPPTHTSTLISLAAHHISIEEEFSIR